MIYLFGDVELFIFMMFFVIEFYFDVDITTLVLMYNTLQVHSAYVGLM